MSFLKVIQESKKRSEKSFALLLDPDKLNQKKCEAIVKAGVESQVSFFLVGGSLITNTFLPEVIQIVKAESEVPVILFPGSPLQIDNSADGILFLSLISGRNAEFLIGQHVIAAPLLKRTNLEIIPTGYILVDCGTPTSVSYMSNTMPVPYDKVNLALSTAMAGEMLGLKVIYLDGGSGAKKPIDVDMISAVSQSVSTPLIVGGGLDSAAKAATSLKAGADLVVIGNAAENDTSIIYQLAEKVANLNASVVSGTIKS